MTEKEDDKCIHWMNPAYCAICLKHDEWDREEPMIFKGLLDKEVKK